MKRKQKKSVKDRVCPYCLISLTMVEIEGGYDGISYYDCPKCGKRWDRFTLKEVPKR